MMIATRLAMTVSALSIFACGSSARFTQRDRTAIEAVLETQRDAWNRGDLDGFMAGYDRSSGLVFTAGGEIKRGWDQAMARYQKRYGGGRAQMGELELELLDIHPLGADGAVVLGRWTVSKTPNAGSGVFSVVFERGDRGWKIVHDHTSSDPTQG